MRSLKRGQAEIIGGIIAVSVLLISIATIYFLAISTQSTIAEEFSKRTSFESERSAEKLTVDYDPDRDTCMLRNAGPIPVEVVRVWYSGAPVDLESPVTLQPGDEVTQVAGVNVGVVEVAVTGRGNVFSVRMLCEEARRRYEHIGEGYADHPAPPYASENILDYVRTSKGVQRGYIYVTIDGSNEAAVAYYYNNTWYCSSSSNKETYTDGPYIPDGLDLDGNGIRELVTINTRDCPRSLSNSRERYINQREVEVKYFFKELLEISGNEDTITIYFKFVVSIGKGAPPHEVSFLPKVTIAGGNIRLSAPATTATAGAPGLVVLSGYAVFPVRSFGLEPPSGTCDLIIELDIAGSPSTSISRIRLEYIAVVGAVFANPWR